MNAGRFDLRSFTDSEVLRLMREAHEDAKTAQKEGAGTHRNAGDAGRISQRSIEWRQEAKARGLCA